MDVPTAIKYFSINHDPQWFSDIQHEFKSDKDYNSESDTITKEVCIIEPVELDLLIPGTYDPVNPPCEDSYHDIEAGLFWYCWYADIGPITSKHIVLKQSLEHLIGVVDNAISHSSDIGIKSRIIIAANKLLIEAAAKMMGSQSDSYVLLIKQFIYQFRDRIKDKYANIFWQYGDDEIMAVDTKQNLQAPKQHLKKKPKLRKTFFENIFQWRNEERELIIDPLYIKFAEQYAEILYQIYHLRYEPQDLKINFTWKKEPIYYIIHSIAATKKGLTMEKIINYDAIRINGDKFKAGACRKGKLNYEKKKSLLKKYIDDCFEDELNRIEG